MRLTSWLLSSICLLASAAQAEPVLHGGGHCQPTASIITRNYPGASEINDINYLQLPAGKAIEAPGQKVLIEGQVLDDACVPVSNAIVEIWQNDPYGRWILANPEDLADSKPVFDGAGRTSTDNQGVFHFITLFPAASGGMAPNFNIRILAHPLHPFATVLYFANDRHNASDKRFSKLSASARQSVSIRVDDSTDLLKGKITIVLWGKIPYRGY